MYSLLASAINHPDRIHDLWGLFNHRSLDALSRQGVDVTAVVPRPRSPPIGPYSTYREIPERDDSFRYPVSHPRFFYLVPKSLFYHRSGDSMASSLRSWYGDGDVSADVLHGCHVYPDGYALGKLSERHSLPLTTYAHGTIINDYGTFNAPTRKRIRWVLGESETVFCSGADVQSTIGEIEPESDTRVVPLGATPSNFPVERREQLREELKIPSDAIVVLFCGHFDENKGVRDLIEVLPRLTDERLYVVCIGHGGDLRDDLRNTLASEGTPSGRVLWKLPPVVVRRWFACADLLVLPSYSEGRPTVIYEAMAGRTPVLASDVGGIPEQVEPGETGWLIRPGDVDALRSKLQQLDRGQLHRMGVAAERRLRDEGWTWASHAESIVDVHRSLLDHDERTDGRHSGTVTRSSD